MWPWTGVVEGSCGLINEPLCFVKGEGLFTLRVCYCLPDQYNTTNDFIFIYSSHLIRHVSASNYSQ